jgi:hypothetical protein
MSKVAANTVRPVLRRTGPIKQVNTMKKRTTEPQPMRVFHNPKGRLCATVEGDRSHVGLKPVWASPLTHPNRYLALLNTKNEEVAMIVDPNDLGEECLGAVQIELSRRYLTATITKVQKANVEFGATYWHVETDRGKRDFVTQNLQENAQWLSPKHLLLLDVDGNRFEIPDVRALDARSVQIVGAIL